MRNLDLHPEPSRDCSATIVDLQLEDEGAWTCMVKEELRCLGDSVEMMTFHNCQVCFLFKESSRVL